MERWRSCGSATASMRNEMGDMVEENLPRLRQLSSHWLPLD